MKKNEVKAKAKELSREFFLINLGIVALGVLLLVFPSKEEGALLLILCRVLAAALCVWGVFKLFEYIRLRNNEIFGSFALIQGCALLVFGVYIMIRPDLLVGFIIAALSIILFIGGVFKLQYALEFSHMRSKSWAIQALAAIIMIAASVVSFINPFTGFHLLVIFLGISLIIDGVWDIFTMFYLRSLVKKFKKGINNSRPGKSSADFVDAEINEDDYDDGFDE